MNARLTNDKELMVTFYEDNSDFDGNDFSCTFHFDRANTLALLKEIDVEENAWDIEKWLKANVRSQSSGYDFEDFCREYGIHGTRTIHEDYAGGIHREESF